LRVSLFTPLLLITQVLIFLAPGIAVGLWLHTKKNVRALYVIPIAALVGGLIGYGIFWLHVLSPAIGGWASVLLLAASWLTIIGVVFTKRYRTALLQTDIILPFALMFSATLFYNAAFLACQPIASPSSCYTEGLPMDNLLPQMFAQHVAEGHPKTLIGDWQGSDRPPLQSGVVLAQAPLVNVSYVGYGGYQLLASFLQCLWIPALWAAGRLLKLSAKQLALFLGLCIVTGFFFFNSVFVWPKLLAASYGLLAFCLVFFEKPRLLNWVIAGSAVAASFLAHSGVMFTLLPMAAFLLLPRYRPSIKIAAAGALTALVLAAPWFAYQRLYDPPGERLAKWFLAGVITPDTRSTGQSLADEYSKVGVAAVAHNKLENMRELVGRIPSEDTKYGGGVLARLRDADFRYLFVGLSVFNIGWVMLLFAPIRKKIRSLDTTKLKITFGIAAASLGLWVLLMFGPATTVIHQGSYLTMLLLFLGLGAILVHMPPKWLRLVIAAQATYFAIVWIITVLAHQQLHYTYLLWMAAALGLGIVCLTYISNLTKRELPHA
jgi:hypothetical protein